MGIGVINSVSAQPTAEDGLFGQYFSRMVKSCSEGSGHSVVSGFQRTPFWQIICTTITDIFKKIPNGATVQFGADGDKVNVKITGNNTTNGDLYVGGNTNIAGGVKIGGDVTVNGTTNLKNTNIDGTLKVTGDTNIGGNVSVNGTTTLKNTNVDGDLKVVGNTNMDGNATINGDMNLKNINVNGILQVSGNANIDGDIKMNGKVDGDLVVNGKVTQTIKPTEGDKESLVTVELLKEILDKRLNSGGAEFKYRARVDGQSCWKSPFSGRMNNIISCYWFEEFDKNFQLTPSLDLFQALIPISKPKKVVLMATGVRESDDWPGADFEPLVFCAEWEDCLLFGKEHKVWDYNNNHLWFTVTVNRDGVVKVRYRAIDWSSGSGWANFIAEIYY